MVTKKMTVPVTARALVQRINRKLAADDERLCATRGERARLIIGDYHVLNVRRNVVVNTHVDIKELGRELGALRLWERMEE